MKIKTILLLVVSSAMLGIAGIQYYWIRTALRSREATFDRNVNEAVSSVIYQMEKYEIASQLKSKLNSIGKSSSLISTIDSLNTALFRELQKLGIDSMNSDSIINITRERISIQISSNQYGEIIHNIDTNVISYQATLTNDSSGNRKLLPTSGFGEQHSLHKPGYPTDNGRDAILERMDRGDKKYNTDSLNKEIDRYLKRAYIIGDVMEDFFNINHFINVEDRIDSAKLDSLITEELKAKGITAEFEYGIFSASRKTMVLQKSGMYRDELMTKGTAFRLFPSDMFSPPEYLLVYFPKRRAYIFAEISGVFTLSMLLLIAVAAAFLFVMFNYLRQKRLTEMKNDFINNMTHEIRTPISTIGLACEAMNDPATGNVAELMSNYIEMIKEENNRLALMAEKILQTAIIDKGGLQLNKEMVDCHELAIRARDSVSLQAEQRGGFVTLDLNADNPIVYADRLHLQSVIYNLLDNALKYTQGKPLITLSTLSNSHSISIIVKDNGVGISKANQKKIFEKLYRVHTGDVHNVKGFGLGLSYVKAIVQAHDGSIYLESEEGQGSIFTIKIPLNKNGE